MAFVVLTAGTSLPIATYGDEFTTAWMATGAAGWTITPNWLKPGCHFCTPMPRWR
jgi:hypothetical protein